MSVSRSLLLFSGLLLLATGSALAAGPFGVGLPEPAPSGPGFLRDIFSQIAAWQSAFYQGLTGSVKNLKADGSAAFWLCGLSFLYGVLHAIGPGHGKVVVSAYVLANRETVRNGAILALLSAAAQGITAVILVGIAAFILGATSIQMTNTTQVFEIGSAAIITGLGGWLVWRKIIVPLYNSFARRYAPVEVGAAAVTGSHGHGHTHHDHHHHSHGHHHPHGHDHHPHDTAACDCGHAHVVPLALAKGPLDWRKAASVMLAVGLRPCTGALIVLVFALTQGLFVAGIVATFAMALGTGITVAALTIAAASGRAVAVRVTSGGEAAAIVQSVFDAGGALALFGLGTAMLGASLAG